MKNLKFSRLFDNKTFCKIFSIVGAIIIWASITLTTQTDSESTIRNVPINFSVSGTSVEALGLNAFNKSEEFVDVRVSGTIANINATSAEDFDVSLSLGNVTAAGKYTIQVDVKLTDSARNVSIIDYSPKKIEIDFDRTASKTIAIETSISNMSAKEGYLLDKGYASSQQVSIIGPETLVKTVNSCIAEINANGKVLDKSFTISDVPLVLYDANKNVINNSGITMDKESVNVTVPVLKTKKLPLSLSFINAPTKFDSSKFAYSLSVKEIEVAGPETTIDSMSQIDIGYADLKNIHPGSTISMPITLPSGFVNVDNISAVDLTIPDEKLIEKKFTAKTFNIIGAPDNKTVKVITKQLSNIVVAGDANLVGQITSNDIVVEINLTDTNISNGTTTVPATITIPGKSGVFWVYGNYEVVIKCS